MRLATLPCLLLGNDLFEIFKDVLAIIVLCPHRELSVAIDAPRIQALLAVWEVVLESLSVAGKLPAAWDDEPLGNIIRVIVGLCLIVVIVAKLQSCRKQHQ